METKQTKPNKSFKHSLSRRSSLLFSLYPPSQFTPFTSPPPPPFLSLSLEVSQAPSMASVTGSTMSIASLSFKHNQAVSGISSLKSVAMPVYGRTFQSLRMSRRFQVSCEAKPETVDKVISIVKKQLALTPETVVSGESKFAALGADSLDTVEIVMGLEEEFGISVEEESAQSIATVQDAADLIQKLVETKEA